MRKFFLFVFSLVSAMAFAIDWDGVAWLKNGSGDDKNTNKYKISAAFGQNVVDIQKPAWATEAGIYSYFLAGVESCTGLAEGKYKIEGAGVILYLSAFTQKETPVKIVAGGSEYECVVFYADGEGDIAPDPDPQPGQQGDLTPAVFSSESQAEILGNQVKFQWSITRNADKTLTFEIAWDRDIEGIVPQISVAGGDITVMPFEGKKAIYTTKATFEDGAALTAFFYIAYPGNAARIDIVGYKVGDSNQSSGDTPGEEPGEGPGEQPGETPGEEPGDQPGEGPGDQGLDGIQSAEYSVQKTFENGQLVILKNGVKYNANGATIQ